MPAKLNLKNAATPLVDRTSQARGNLQSNGRRQLRFRIKDSDEDFALVGYRAEQFGIELKLAQAEGLGAPGFCPPGKIPRSRGRERLTPSRPVAPHRIVPFVACSLWSHPTWVRALFSSHLRLPRICDFDSILLTF